jgi:hypothetical protein
VSPFSLLERRRAEWIVIENLDVKIYPLRRSIRRPATWRGYGGFTGSGRQSRRSAVAA